MVITGLTTVPDETTICRFRNLLSAQDLYQPLLDEVNNLLRENGLKVQESKGAIIDATILQSCSRPKKSLTPYPLIEKKIRFMK